MADQNIKEHAKTVAFYQAYYYEKLFLTRELIMLDTKAFFFEQKHEAAKIIPKDGDFEGAKDWLSSKLMWGAEDERELEYLRLLQDRYKERLEAIENEIESI